MEAKCLKVVKRDDLSDDYITLNSPSIISLDMVTSETGLYTQDTIYKVAYAHSHNDQKFKYV